MKRLSILAALIAGCASAPHDRFAEYEEERQLAAVEAAINPIDPDEAAEYLAYARRHGYSLRVISAGVAARRAGGPPLPSLYPYREVEQALGGSIETPAHPIPWVYVFDMPVWQAPATSQWCMMTPSRLGWHCQDGPFTQHEADAFAAEWSQR